MPQTAGHNMLGSQRVHSMVRLPESPDTGNSSRVEGHIHLAAGVGHRAGVLQIAPHTFDATLFQVGISAARKTANLVARLQQLVHDVATQKAARTGDKCSQGGNLSKSGGGREGN